MNGWRISSTALGAVCLALILAFLGMRQQKEAADELASAYIQADLVRQGWHVSKFRDAPGPTPPGTERIAAGRGSVHWGPEPQKGREDGRRLVPGSTPGSVANPTEADAPPPRVATEAERPPAPPVCDLQSLSLDVSCDFEIVSISDKAAGFRLFQSAVLTAPDGRQRVFPRTHSDRPDVFVPRARERTWSLTGLVGASSRPGLVAGLAWTSSRHHGAWATAEWRSGNVWSYEAGYAFRLR